MVSKIKVDEIEASQGSNITFNHTPKVDTISEKTSGSGVTVDGVLLKDNQMAGTYLDGGMIKLATVTASNTAEIDFSTSVTGWNNTTYRSFIVRGRWIKPATDTARLYQYLASGTSKRTGTYELGTYQARVDASASGYYQQDQSGQLEIGTFQLGTNTRESMAFEMQVFPAGDSGSAPSGTVMTGGLFRCVIKGYNAATYSMQGGFQYDSTSYMDGIYLSMSTGNIDQGEFEFYGVK